MARKARYNRTDIVVMCVAAALLLVMLILAVNSLSTEKGPTGAAVAPLKISVSMPSLKVQAAPGVTSINLVTTNPLRNNSGQNLTLSLAVTDSDSDPVSNATDWRVNDSSIAVVNMNFDFANSAGAGKVKEYSSYGNTGTVIGATWITAGKGNTGAYNFSGTSQYISLPNVASLRPVQMTVAAWVYADTFAYNVVAARDFRGDGTWTDPWMSWDLEVSSAGAPYFWVASGTGVSGYASSGFNLSTGRWYHLVGTYDGATVKLYIDGSLNVSGAYAGGIGYAGTNVNATIGSGSDKSPNSFWDGRIDDVKIYNRALSAQQVLALYNNRSDLIVSQELAVGDVWKACVTPNDGTQDGALSCSNNVTILSNAPIVNSINLTSTDPAKNDTNQNLTLALAVSADAGANVTNVTTWFLNGTSISLLNLPFDTNVTSTAAGAVHDYSPNANHCTLGNGSSAASPLWQSAQASGGPRAGQYYFDGGDNIVIPHSSSLSEGDEVGISTWVYLNGSGRNNAQIADDTQTGFWSVYSDGCCGGTGATASWSIAISDNVTNKQSGANSLEMRVTSGSQMRIGMGHTYASRQDWSGYDYFAFYWYGANTKTMMDVAIQTGSDGSPYDEASDCLFVDDWTGWRLLAFPLASCGGSGNFSKVKQLYILTLGGMPSGTPSAFTWYIDREVVAPGRFIYEKDSNGTKPYSGGIAKTMLAACTNCTSAGQDAVTFSHVSRSGYSAVKTSKFAASTAMPLMANITKDAWHHVFAGMSRQSNATVLYVDNVLLDNSYLAPVISPRIVNDPAYIGTHENTQGWLNGTLAELQLYNRSLSSHEVSLLYANRTDTLANDELAVGDVWQACVTPNDGYQDGAQACSNNVTIIMPPAVNPPVVNSVSLSSSDPSNTTSGNLSLLYSTSSAAGRNVTNITNWYARGSSALLLNMPFEANGLSSVSDYSGWNNAGTATNTTALTGMDMDGSGALCFNGSAYVKITDADSLDLNTSWAMEANVNVTTTAVADVYAPYNVTPRNPPFGYYEPYHDLSMLGDHDNSTGPLIAVNPADMTFTFAQPVVITRVVVHAGQFNGPYNAPSSMTLYEGNQTTTSLASLGISYSDITTLISGAKGNTQYTIESTGGYSALMEITFYGYPQKRVIGKEGGYVMSIVNDRVWVETDSGVATATVTAGWHHIVATGNSGTVKIYIDGALANTTTGLTTKPTDTPLYIGQGFTGGIGNVRLWNRTLSSQEVNLLFSNHSDTIASQELTGADVWKGCITPNDGVQDGTQVCSNNLTVTGTVVIAISNVASGDIVDTSANVSWTTDLSSNSSVQYGTTTAFGQSAGSGASGTSHKVALTGLTNGTFYYYNVTSCTAGFCTSSGPYNFTTMSGYYPNCPATNGLWTVSGNYNLVTNVSCDAITVNAGGSIVVNGSYGIFANTMTVTGTIDASATGCASSTSATAEQTCVNQVDGGFGNNNAPGMGEGGDNNFNSNQGGSGAGYGGYGGPNANLQWTGGKPYGSALRPFMKGSGGGSSFGAGGTGGGAVRIVTSSLTVSGSIRSDGGNGTGQGGGGSGGSIWIDAGSLAGAGIISTKGGNAPYRGGAGSGGRVAVYYTTSTFSGMSSSSVDAAPAGSEGYTGSAGSMIFVDTDDNLATIVGGMEFNASDVSPYANLRYGNEFGFTNLTFLNTPLLFMTTNVSANVIDIDGGFGVDTQRPFYGVTILANSSAKPTYLMLNATDLRKSASVTISSISNVQVQEPGTELLGNLVVTSMTLNATGPVSLGALTCSGTCIVESEVGISAASSVTAGQLHLIAPNITFTGATIAAGVVGINATERFSMDGSSSVSASGRGCAASTSNAPGFTCANQVDGGFGGSNDAGVGEGADYSFNNAYGGSGGAFGGFGGDAKNHDRRGGRPYGSALRPFALGSGGGNSYAAGGAGGGIVRIIAPLSSLSGSILADGAAGVSGYAGGGGGSGGSVWIEANTLSGSASISAKGGNGGTSAENPYGAGGSGGRVAVYSNSSSWTGTSTSSVNGGAGGQYSFAGEPGTMIFVDLPMNSASVVGGMEFNNSDAYPAGSFKPTAGSLVKFGTIAVTGPSLIRFKGGDITLNASLIDFTASNVSVDNGTRLTINYANAASKIGRAYSPNGGSAFLLTVNKQSYGKVDWSGRITGIANLDSDLALTSNNVYVNTVSSPGLNVSANVSIVTGTGGYSIMFDDNDDGVGTLCTFCTDYGLANGAGRFSAPHFSSYWLSSAHDFIAPLDNATNTGFVFNSSVNGTLMNGSMSDIDQIIDVVDVASGKPKLELTGAFSRLDVNLSGLVVLVSGSKTVVITENITGVAPTHAVFVPVQSNAGVYVCPNATRLNDVVSSCLGYTRWTYGEAVAGTSKQLDNFGYNVTVTIVGSDYKITGLRGTGVAEGGSTTLTIWDDTDSGMPYAGFTRFNGDMVNFYANFTNTSGLPANATTGACRINVQTPAYGGYFPMSWNATTKLFHYNTTEFSAGTYEFKVNCTGTSGGTVENLETTDTVLITQGFVSADVPEFGTWALLIALGLVAGGIVSMRSRGGAMRSRGGSMGLRGGMRGMGSAKRTK